MLDSVEATYVASARDGDEQSFATLVERYRAELRAYCYRMLGCLEDAEDLTQDAMMRAWQRLSTFEGRGSFKGWLYRIATNACLDALEERSRRILPALFGPPADPTLPFAPPPSDPTWLDPFPDGWLPGVEPGPEALYSLHESVSLAFLVALQALPPRQRAVLVLCDVLDWRAREVAELLGVTSAAVTSALQRARATLRHPTALHDVPLMPADDATQALLERYVRAWEQADVDGLVALLREDAALTMPPSPSWYRGHEAIRFFLSTIVLAANDPARWRALATRANGQPAIALYMREQATGRYLAYAIQVLTLDAGLLAEMTTFKNPGLFPRFSLVSELSSPAAPAT